MTQCMGSRFLVLSIGFIPFLWGRGGRRGGDVSLTVSLLQMDVPGSTVSITSLPTAWAAVPTEEGILPLPTPRYLTYLPPKEALRPGPWEWCKKWFSNLSMHQHSLGACERPTHGAIPWVCDWVAMRWGSRICLSDKFSGEAHAAGPQHLEPLA